MILATDMDRTLLPNGQPLYQEGSLEQLFKIINEVKPTLIYVTGRNLGLMQEAVDEYKLQLPDYFIGEVGTRLYKKQDQKMVEFSAWTDHIKNTNPAWKRQAVEEILADETAVQLQEGWKQNEFKVSYYLSKEDEFERLHGILRRELDKRSIKAQIIYSYEPLEKLGLIDILPGEISKLAALEYLRTTLGISKDDVVYCGDSGNDILPLTFGYKAIAVKNTPETVKQQLRSLADQKKLSDNLYIASGKNGFNGNYAAGIIEGLGYYKFVKL